MKFLVLFKVAFLVCILNAYTQNDAASIKAEKQRIDKYFHQVAYKENPRLLVFVKVPKKINLQEYITKNGRMK